MAEDFKSPWQIEHEKMLAAQEAEKKAEEKKKRREFLRGLKITRKSSQNLHELVKAEESADEENLENAAETLNQPVLSYEDGRLIDHREDEFKELEKVSIFSKIIPLGAVFKKIWPLLLLFFTIFAGSVYALSPLNRISSFKVAGNSIVKSNEIANSSGLTMQSSIFQIFTHRTSIAAKVTNSSPRIKSTLVSISFPNKVTLSVKEFENIGFVEQKGKDYAILANGTIISETVISANKLGTNPLLLKDFSASQTKEFALAYESLAPSLRGLIRTVTITPTQTTSDFITLQMADGNFIKVPLSQMKEKLPWYPSIAKQVTAPTTVDMEIVEAGIFTSPSPQYDVDFADDTPAGLSKSESASKAAASTASSSSSTTSSSN